MISKLLSQLGTASRHNNENRNHNKDKSKLKAYKKSLWEAHVQMMALPRYPTNTPPSPDNYAELLVQIAAQ